MNHDKQEASGSESSNGNPTDGIRKKPAVDSPSMPEEETASATGPKEENNEKVIDRKQLRKIEEFNKEIESRLFAGAQPAGGSKRRMINFFVTAAGIMLLLLFIISLVTARFVERDLLCRTPVDNPAAKLSPKEKQDLMKQLSLYEQALEAHLKNSVNHEDNKFKLELTSSQLNEVLSKMEGSRSPNGLSRVFMTTEGNKASIDYSIPFGRGVFFNVTMEGEPRIKNYRFYMKVDRIRVGQLSNSRQFQGRAIRRINRFLETEPARLRLPFLIEDMQVKESKIYLTLKFRKF